METLQFVPVVENGFAVAVSSVLTSAGSNTGFNDSIRLAMPLTCAAEILVPLPAA
jgi:hypothetical protein